MATDRHRSGNPELEAAFREWARLHHVRQRSRMAGAGAAERNAELDRLIREWEAEQGAFTEVEHAQARRRLGW